jgi:hypothetical protein
MAKVTPAGEPDCERTTNDVEEFSQAFAVMSEIRDARMGAMVTETVPDLMTTYRKYMTGEASYADWRNAVECAQARTLIERGVK